MPEQLNNNKSQDKEPETSLVVQWLQLQAPNAEGQAGFNPGQATRSHMPQLEISHVTTKTGCNQKKNKPRLGA